MREVSRVVSVCCALGAIACGSEAPADGANGGERPARNRSPALAPPQFDFTPGPPGRAVGVRAIVEVDGLEITTEPLELTLLVDSAAQTLWPTAAASPSGSAEWLGRTRAAQSAACPAPGSQATEIGTINGDACFLVQTVASGSLGVQESVQTFIFFGREGLYLYAEEAANITYPPDLGSSSFSLGFGCVGGDVGDDNPTALSYEYLTKLENVGFSYSILFYSVGFSFFTFPKQGIRRGIQFDAGIQASLQSLFPIPVNFSVSLERSSSALFPAFQFARPYAGSAGCTRDPGPQNPLEFTRDRLAEFEQMDAVTLEDALAVEIARGAGPLMQSLGSPGAGGLADNVPAASNADQLADYLGGSGTEIREGQPNTSLDGLTEDFRDRLVEGDGDNAAVLSGVSATIGQANRSVPSSAAQAALLGRASNAVEAGRELGELTGPAMVGRQRFISQEVRRITVEAGAPIELVITAREVADLIGRPVADVEGATVFVNAGPDIVDEAFVLEGPELALSFDTDRDSLLVRTDVDLGTAAGGFPADVSDWIVRPALRIFEVEAGPASSAHVTGPSSLPSGGPASLTVQVLDESGRLVRRPFNARFVDAEGNSLGSIDAEQGSALFQYVPEPSAPRIALIVSAMISSGGQQFPGLSVSGVGFSTDASVLVDGSSLMPGTDFQVASPEEILVLTTNVGAGAHELQVQNPEGLSSETHTFELATP